LVAMAGTYAFGRLLGGEGEAHAQGSTGVDLLASFEQDLAASKGVRIITNASPVAVHGNGTVREIEFEYTDNDLKPTGQRFRLAADQVFKAIGQTLTGDNLPGLQGGKIAVTGAGCTSVTGIWAGGDCATGGDDLTVTAVAEGRDAAMDIHTTLMG
ncbi:MAG: FAD-dependent oxidoreductase, partial [Paracoccaceae bacterium]|nr:FAD-dependent oxidoreductase [Paracoccaceae bacterium]